MMVAVFGRANSEGASPEVPRESPDDARALARHAATLADGIEAALGPWVEACVARVITAWAGVVDPEIRAAAERAGAQARAGVAPRVRALLAQDVDEQRTTPLAVVRGAVAYPTDVLAAAGVPPVARDELAASAFPDDVYDLSPAAFADLAPELAGPGIVWGAAKAHVVLARRRGRP